MALTQNPVNIGAAPDDNSGDVLRVAFDKINQGGADAIAAINNLLTLIGAGNETTVDLGTFLGSTIADGRTVKQALQGLETYVEALNVLDAGYTAGAATAPVAGDTIEAAIAKLHGMLSAIDQAVVLRGNWNAGSGTFPGGGTAQAGDSYIVNGAGTVDGVSFAVGDRVIALVDNASTTQQSAWFKADYTDQVGSVFGRQGAVVAQAGDYTATQITNTPAGGIAGVTVQAALNELDGDKLNVSLLAAKGSIVTATAANTPQGLGVGVDGEALTADAATASGLRYTAQVSRTLAQANLTANTTLTAGTSVDVATHIAFAQTTANIRATIPNPTDPAKRRTIMLSHNGTAVLEVLFASGTGFFLNPGESVAVTWSGSAWQGNHDRLAVATEYLLVSRTATALPMSVGSTIGYNTVESSAGPSIPFTAGVFTLQPGKTYELEGHPGTVEWTIGGTQNISYQWRNITTNALIGNEAEAMAGSSTGAIGSGQGTALAYITPTVLTTVRLEVIGMNGNAVINGLAQRKPWARIKVVAGHAPILGTTVDFAYARLTASTLVAPGAAVPLVTQSGNIPNTGGVFSLRAGRTYRLTGAAAYAGGGTMAASSNSGVVWRDITNNVTVGGFAQLISPNANDTASSLPIAEAIITPTTDITVRLEYFGAANSLSGAVGNGGSTFGTIVQIGSTAFSGAIDYSTQEQDTGRKWIDGKPIFRRTFDVSAVPNLSTLIPAGVVAAMITQSGRGNTGVNLHMLPWEDGTSTLHVYQQGINGVVTLGRAGVFVTPRAGEFVTLEYTKV